MRKITFVVNEETEKRMNELARKTGVEDIGVLVKEALATHETVVHAMLEGATVIVAYGRLRDLALTNRDGETKRPCNACGVMFVGEECPECGCDGK